MPFFVIFVLIPLAEILVFIKVSQHIGMGTALLLALITAIIGGAIVRHQGIKTLLSARDKLQGGVLPSQQLFDGLCIVAAGATLITPGFITDILGFSLLIPQFRQAIRSRFSGSSFGGAAHFNTEYTEFHDQKNHHRSHDPDVIDVEYETIDDDKKA